MTVLIKFTTIGINAGPFALYSDVTGPASPFEVGVTRAQLLAGFPSSNVPDGTTVITALSTGACTTSFSMTVTSTSCFNLLPVDNINTYILAVVMNPTNSYIYGSFTSYLQAGVSVSSSRIVKLKPDLTIDTSFVVGTGFNAAVFTGSAIIQQADGKIIVTGNFTSYQGVSANRIIRLNTDGSRDNTFVIGTGFAGANNLTQFPAIDSLGRILVTGSFTTYKGVSTVRIARLLTDGTLDTTLVTGSGFGNTTLSVLPNPDNSMFVTGYFSGYKGLPVSNSIAKIDSVGNLDTAFNTNAGTGFLPTGNLRQLYMLRIPGETSFYVAGFYTSYKGIPESRIIKLDMLGNKDVSFNPGTGFDNNVFFISLVWNNKIYLEGSFTSYNGVTALGFIVLNTDGTVFYAPTTAYYTSFIIGDNLYARESTGCLKVVFTNPNTSTTTTSSSTSSTSSTTSTSTTAAPTTSTTSTSTTFPVAFGYNVDYFTCSCFAGTISAGILCNIALVTGQYYYDSLVNRKMHVIAATGNTPSMPTSIVNIGSQQATCAAVVCPPATAYVFSPSWATAAGACAEPSFTLTLYSSSPTLVFGSRLYTNIGLTVPYNGLGAWFKHSSLLTKVWRIDTNGFIDGISNCP